MLSCSLHFRQLSGGQYYIPFSCNMSISFPHCRAGGLRDVVVRILSLPLCSLHSPAALVCKPCKKNLNQRKQNLSVMNLLIVTADQEGLKSSFSCNIPQTTGLVLFHCPKLLLFHILIPRNIICCRMVSHEPCMESIFLV